MDSEWHRLMRRIIMDGEKRQDRTGVGTRAIFGMRAEFDLREGFPACTTKRLGFGQVRAELAAFLIGADSLDDFNRLGCTLWDANASAPAWVSRQRFPRDVGRIYGAQWRSWRYLDERMPSRSLHPAEMDQMQALVRGLKADPHGRRHLVTAWNPGELDRMCLPPCHIGFQCYASDEGADEYYPRGSLDLEFRMRSLDVFIGMPFDVASYALLLCLLAKETGRRPRRLIMTSGDTHLYNNHVGQAEVALSRVSKKAPYLNLAERSSPFAFMPEDAQLMEYESHPAIPAPMNI